MVHWIGLDGLGQVNVAFLLEENKVIWSQIMFRIAILSVLMIIVKTYIYDMMIPQLLFVLLKMSNFQPFLCIIKLSRYLNHSSGQTFTSNIFDKLV